jgi:hypothetical protein
VSIEATAFMELCYARSQSMRIHSSRKKIPELVSSVRTKAGLIEVTDTARRNRTESSNPSAPTIINLLELNRLSRILSVFNSLGTFHTVPCFP